MKKIIALLLAVLMLVACTACGSSKAESKDRLAQIKEKGYIEVATEPYFAPFEFIDPSKEGDAQYVGVDMLLAQAIADELGVELRVVPLEFSAVLVGITEGKYDLAISALAYSEERNETMNLSAHYLKELSGDEGAYGFVCREEDAEKYNSIEDLTDAVVITQSGSVQEGLFNQYITEKGCKEFKRMSSMTDCFLAVKEGKADVCICDVDNAQLYADANGGLFCPTYRFPSDPNEVGTVLAAPKDNTDSLMESVNAVINKLEDDGTLMSWYNEMVDYALSLGLETY